MEGLQNCFAWLCHIVFEILTLLGAGNGGAEALPALTAGHSVRERFVKLHPSNVVVLSSTGCY